MRLWRLCKRRWADTAMSGRGAAENPGRWNSAGRRAVYCAESRALAALEILANTPNKRRLRKAAFVAIPVDVPEALIAQPARFPPGWDVTPAPRATRVFGDRHLASPRSPVFRVPSVVVRGEWCFVLNPEHPRFPEIKVGRAEAFSFDERVIEHGR
jgi:RES domain-containing protein